jgi:hypothetical protein
MRPPTRTLRAALLVAGLTATAMAWAAETASPVTFTLTLTYAERIAVPAGSELNVRVHDAAGQMVFEQKTATTRNAPPYTIGVSVPRATSFPLRVDVELVSRIGHRFGERAELAQSDIQASVTIRMRRR